MQLRTHYSNYKKGFSLVELLIAISIMLIMFFSISVLVNPIDNRMKSRDSKRLNDLSILERAVSEFQMDNGSYPDSLDTLRISTSLPPGSTDIYSASFGWIYADFSSYITKMPVDPINDDVYYYSYYHDPTGYELNARLEILTEFSQNDGGNDSSIYEVGNNLLLIEP